MSTQVLFLHSSADGHWVVPTWLLGTALLWTFVHSFCVDVSFPSPGWIYLGVESLGREGTLGLTLGASLVFLLDHFFSFSFQDVPSSWALSSFLLFGSSVQGSSGICPMSSSLAWHLFLELLFPWAPVIFKVLTTPMCMSQASHLSPRPARPHSLCTSPQGLAGVRGPCILSPKNLLLGSPSCEWNQLCKPETRTSLSPPTSFSIIFILLYF